jgi:hypothetical protein
VWPVAALGTPILLYHIDHPDLISYSRRDTGSKVGKAVLNYAVGPRSANLARLQKVSGKRCVILVRWVKTYLSDNFGPASTNTRLIHEVVDHYGRVVSAVAEISKVDQKGWTRKRKGQECGK